MKIICTGMSGFVGKHTAKLLESEGYEVFNYSLYTGYDILDYDQLKSVIRKGDKILHLAAISRFGMASLNPGRTMAINVGGTLNVIRAAIEKKANRVVHASTGSVYMPVLEVPIKEIHRIIGNSDYGYSKTLAERMYELYAMDKINHVILRYAHLYGKGKDWGGIGHFINRLKRGMKPTLFGASQSNDFCYVKDIARANLSALTTPINMNEAYNIGTGKEINIKQAYDMIQEAMNTDIEPIIETTRNVDAPRFVFDVSKAEKKLRFKARWTFKEGIKDMLGEM